MSHNQQNSCLRRAHDLANDADRHVIVIEHTQADEIAHAHRLRKAMAHPIGQRVSLRSSSLGLMLREASRPLGCVQRTAQHRGRRLVAVPIEAVAILGRQLASLDMMPEEYAAAPTWTGGGELIAADEKILIGLTRR
jgi:hypothetical protein